MLLAASRKNNAIETVVNSNKYGTNIFIFVVHNIDFSFRTFDVNVKAVLNISQVIARKMVENNTHGTIVNISSQASKVGYIYRFISFSK